MLPPNPNPRFEFTAEQRADVAARYRAGETASSIAVDYPVGRHLVTRLVRELGIYEVRRAGRSGRFSDEEKRVMSEWYVEGATVKELAEVFDCRIGHVSLLLAGLGVPMRPRGRPRKS